MSDNGSEMVRLPNRYFANKLPAFSCHVLLSASITLYRLFRRCGYIPWRAMPRLTLRCPCGPKITRGFNTHGPPRPYFASRNRRASPRRPRTTLAMLNAGWPAHIPALIRLQTMKHSNSIFSNAPGALQTLLAPQISSHCPYVTPSSLPSRKPYTHHASLLRR